MTRRRYYHLGELVEAVARSQPGIVSIRLWPTSG
jgi:hypothetical protein